MMANRKVACFAAQIVSLLLFEVSMAVLVNSKVSHGGGNGGGGDDDEDGVQGMPLSGREWEILTKRNFSSEIRTHPHLLVMVTVPWSGETRSVMKEVTRLVSMKQEEFGRLKLMLVYRNSEKVLVDALDASEDITLIYFHHSIPYKYRGHLRAHNILSSVYYLMMLNIEEVPLKHLKSKEELSQFYQSTDKAFLIFEFCGWSENLLKRTDAQSVDQFSENVDTVGENSTKETGRKPGVFVEDSQDLGNEKLTCGAETELDHSFVTEFGSANGSASNENKNTYHDMSMSCTLEEFQQFKSFFSKLIVASREYFLPPERQRFGLVSDVSLLPFLGIENLESWSLMVHFSGCPNCSMVCKEEDKLQILLQKRHPLVVELDGNTVPVLPAEGPSIVLFVDRSSESSKVRGESKAALEILRKFALRRNVPYELNDSVSSILPFLHSASPRNLLYSNKQRGKTFPLHQVLKVQENMAVLVVNEGESMSNMASDSQSNPAYDILAHLLRSRELAKTKEAKISLLAKEVGFQLLSDDFEVQVVDTSESLKEDDGFSYRYNNAVKDQESEEQMLRSEQGHLLFDASYIENIRELENLQSKDHMMFDDGVCNIRESVAQICDVVRPVDVLWKLPYYEEYSEYAEDYSGITDTDQLLHLSDNAASIIEDAFEVNSYVRMPVLNELVSHSKDFLSSIFFSDGGYQLLGTMTMDSNVPSLVIVDPVSRKHYIFPKETEMNYSSLVNFVENFFMGNLSPFQRSESSSINTREFPDPPFVNLDFHEAFSIPRLTAMEFCELVPGLKHCEQRNGHSALKMHSESSSLDTDLLVLFSSSWCGFCQHMELIIREVYRELKSFCITSKGKTKDFQDVVLPLIFQMDCTRNDCGPFLTHLGKEENYPVLVLFPNEAKETLIYEGDLSVISVFEFLFSHGIKLSFLRKHKGLFWNDSSKKRDNRGLLQDISHLPIHDKNTKNKNQLLTGHPIPADHVRPVPQHHTSGATSNKGSINPRPGTIFSATDTLRSSPPFNNATILIVVSAINLGFQGVITNKPISWNFFPEFDSELDFLRTVPLFYGGPVMMHSLSLVSLSRKPVENYTEVSAGIFFGDPTATSLTIKQMKSEEEHSPEDFWFFLGYSGWGWNQLLDEFAAGAWSLSNSSIGDLGWPDNYLSSN